MIYSLSGKLAFKKSQFVVIDVGGVGYKVFVSQKTFKKLPAISSKINLLCSYHVRQDMPEIYGFLDEKELEIFDLLTSINGVGPKSALTILGNIKIDKFLSAINHNRSDLISDGWGIGKKKAERIVLELKDKVKKSGIFIDAEILDSDKDIKSALRNLGYKPKEVEEAIDKIPASIKKVEVRLKLAIKTLSRK